MAASIRHILTAGEIFLQLEMNNNWWRRDYVWHTCFYVVGTEHTACNYTVPMVGTGLSPMESNPQRQTITYSSEISAGSIPLDWEYTY